jgi:preprotein translocase subunit SecE|tara:strand:+ start:99 stop:368 length:270 start_codon:yes stop_codon:yes gene_type:complete
LVERRPPKPEVEGSSPSSPAKLGNFDMFKKINDYFKSIGSEMKKVSWMNKQQIINSTIIVGIFSLIISVFLFVLDFGLSEIVKVLFNLN